MSLPSNKAEHSPWHGEEPKAYFVTVSAFLQRKEKKTPNIKLQLVQILLEQKKDTMVSRQEVNEQISKSDLIKMPHTTKLL